MAHGGLQVDLPTLGHRRHQRLQVADNHWRFIEVNRLDGQARHALRQIGTPGEKALAQRRYIEQWQFARVVCQVPCDHLVPVGRVRGQRPHHSETTALRRKHAGHVEEWLCIGLDSRQTQFGRDPVLLVQAQRKVEQARVHGSNQTRQRNGGTHVGHRFMRVVVRKAIGARQVAQLETGFAIVFLRPNDAIGTQGVTKAHHIQQVPAATIVLPLTRIRVDQIAPEHEARDFVVEADRVVAHADGAGLGKHALDLRRELMLGYAAFQAHLRRDAGDQAGLRTGQEIGCRLAIEHQRLADFIEFRIGPDAGELRRAVAPHVSPEGFVVVPEKGV